ncbi:hypothetical protein, partial [Prevotella sp.]
IENGVLIGCKGINKPLFTPPFLLNKHKLYIKQLLSQIERSLPKPLQGRGCVPKSLSFYRKESLSPNPTTASPPAPLRME